MPNLSCWSCGRQIYTVAPLEALFAEERRCPRCGAFLHEDRREFERRLTHRRSNPSDDPGPPKPARRAAKLNGGDGIAVDGGERRVVQRRTAQRRGANPVPPPAAATDSGGWRD